MSDHRRRTHIAIVMCAIGLCSSPAQSDPRAATRPAAAARVAEAIIELTNVERNHQGRRPVSSDVRLMRAAQLQADQMARAGQLAHVLPEATYPRAADRLKAADYRWQTYGENIALGQSSATDVVKAWMHSRGHRANILKPDFTEMGAGYAVDTAGRPYYVQVFAAPLP